MGRVKGYIGDKFGQNATFCDNSRGNAVIVENVGAALVAAHV